MVAQKGTEIAIGKPALGIQGQEHLVDAEERRFQYQVVDGRWWWGEGGMSWDGRMGRGGGGGVGGGGEGDAGAKALAPEHEARSG